MDAHRVEVFNRADNDAVIVLISNDLHLEFFPANQRFIDKQFVSGRQLETALTNRLKLDPVVSNPATRTAHCE